MAKNNIIDVYCFDQEIGKLGFDEDKNKSFFQYHPSFLEDNQYRNLFPATGIIKKTAQTQVFGQFNTDTFRGLPPMIADSLPDMFGNLIFKKWLESSSKNFNKISVLEQLTYVANRGMGALEYQPRKTIPNHTSIDITEITAVLKKVLQNKEAVSSASLNSEALFNIFKIGTSAGGARPKILVSERTTTGEIIPGDLNYSEDYDHYIVKLSVDDDLGYKREVLEYSYYLIAQHLNIRMMSSKLIDDKHFATLRFDRQHGEKKHFLTATGLTGWDFKDPDVSSYENLFELALFLKIPHTEREELYKRMVFNVIFCNTDDHLKNHAFLYDKVEDKWHLSPAYDLTYALNPLINYKRTSRALSINNKRVDITQEDLLKLADTYTIKNAKNVILDVEHAVEEWESIAQQLKLSSNIINSIKQDFKLVS